MRVGRNVSLARGLFGVALLAAAPALLTATARAQSAGRASRDAAMRQRNAEMMRELQSRRREGTVGEAKPEEPPHPSLPYARGKEDFRALQLVNNEMMREVFTAAGPTDYGRVAASLAEINKRAARLMSNLKLPEPATEPPRHEALSISNDGQLKASLRALDKLIMEFVTNPAFRNSGTI